MPLCLHLCLSLCLYFAPESVFCPSVWLSVCILPLCLSECLYFAPHRLCLSVCCMEISSDGKWAEAPTERGMGALHCADAKGTSKSSNHENIDFGNAENVTNMCQE